MSRTTYIYKVNNPHTGAVEFPEHQLLCAWVGYCIGSDGRSHVVGYSNDPTEATAAKYISRFVMSGTEVRVVPARPANAAERDAYLARRAQLAPTDTQRAKWARTLTNAAIDHSRNGDDEVEVKRGREHLAALVDDAMRAIAGPDPMAYAGDHRKRITTRADVAARWFLIVERDLDNRPRTEAIEHRITQYLKKRDDLIRALEAITPH